MSISKINYFVLYFSLIMCVQIEFCWHTICLKICFQAHNTHKEDGIYQSLTCECFILCFTNLLCRICHYICHLVIQQQTDHQTLKSLHLVCLSVSTLHSLDCESLTDRRKERKTEAERRKVCLCLIGVSQEEVRRLCSHVCQSFTNWACLAFVMYLWGCLRGWGYGR